MNMSTPVPPEIAEWASKTPYRPLIGSLMYHAVATRPDISYVVLQCEISLSFAFSMPNNRRRAQQLRRVREQ